MKTTITLYDYLESELIAMGLDDFVKDGLLITSRSNNHFIRKMIRYDEEVDMIMTNLFFAGCQLETKSADQLFKKAFVNRFLNREFMYQTVEVAMSQVVFIFLKHEDYLNRYYTALDQYLLNKSEQENTGGSNQKSDNRSLSSDLPQDNINLNVEDTVLDYGTNNAISRSKTDNTNQSNQKNQSAKLADLKELAFMLEEVFNDFDENCFLQIF